MLFNPIGAAAFGIGYGIADDALKIKLTKFEGEIKPSLEINAAADLFFGVNPSISIGLIDCDIVSLVFEGKLGCYVKGDIHYDISQLWKQDKFKAGFSEFNPDDLCETYDLYGGTNTSLECGLRTGFGIKLETLQFFDPDDPLGKFLSNSWSLPIAALLPNDFEESTNTPPGLIHDKEDELNHDYPKFNLSVTPIFDSPIKMSDTSAGVKVEVTERRGVHALSPYIGIAVVDAKNPDSRKYIWNKKVQNGWEKEVHDFIIPKSYMEIGKSYIIYPIYWATLNNLTPPWEYTDIDECSSEIKDDFESRIILCSPHNQWLATPEFKTGEVRAIEHTNAGGLDSKYEYEIVDWEIGRFKDPKGRIGFVVIDAGQITAGEENVDMSIQDQKYFKWIPIEDPYVLVNIENGLYDNLDPNPELHFPPVKLTGLQEGHRYYYALYFDADPYDNKVDYFTESKSFVTEGEGMTIKALAPVSYGHDYAYPRGVVSWFNETPIIKDLIDIELVIYQQGFEEDAETIKLDPDGIINSYIFEVGCDGLLDNTTYVYYFRLKYNGESRGVSNSQKFKTDKNKAKDIPIIRTFNARLLSASSNSATFEIGADWDASDDDVVEIGIIYYRNMPNVPTEGDLVYSNIGTRLFPKLVKKKKDWNDGVQYACWRNSKDKDDTNYASQRGWKVNVQLTGLYPEQPKTPERIYYYRPYIKFSNSTTLRSNQSDANNNWNEIILATDESGNLIRKDLLLYGDMSTFSTNPGNDKTEKLRIAQPVLVDNVYYWPVENRGFYENNRSGIVYSNAGKKLVRDTQGVGTLKGKKTTPKSKTMARIAKMRRAAEEDIEDPDDDEYSADDYNEYYETEDLTALIKNETYMMRAFYETEDGRIIYSDEFEMTYTNEKGGDAVNYRFVDLGLSVDWAEANVGGTASTDFGNYYAWGENTTKDEYTEDNYTSPPVDNIAGYEDYDVATASYGIESSIPTKAQWDELKEKCTWKWTTIAGVNGYEVTGPNGNAIFLPAAGNRYIDRLYSGGEGGCYWTSESSVIDVEADVTSATDADRMHFNVKEEPAREPGRKYYGRSVRAVKTK